MKPQRWLISYDICEEKRLRQIAAACEAQASRLQKSLFLADINKDAVPTIREQIETIIQSPDRVMLRPICRHCLFRERWQGAGGHPEYREPFWIV
jgi:CRISPR-associated protein Cas2